MNKNQHPFARRVRFLALAVVPGTCCLAAAPAIAETRAGVVVSVSGRVESNPYLQANTSESVAGEVQVDPWLKFINETSSVDVRGTLRGAAYSGGKGTDRTASLTVDGRSKVSSYLNVRGGATYLNSNAGSRDLLARDSTLDGPPLPVTPTPDITFVGTRTRTELIEGRLGLTATPSPLDSVSIDLGAQRARFGSIAGANYDNYNAMLGYSRRLSERTSITADAMYSKADYTGGRAGDGRIITPRLGMTRQFSPTLSATASLGASFSRTRLNNGGLVDSTTLSGSLNLCNRGDRSVYCVNVNRSAQPRAVGGITAVTSVDLTYDTRLSLRDTFGLTARYARNDAAVLIGGSTDFYALSANLSHSFGERLFGFVSPAFSRASGDFFPARNNYQLAVGLRYSFGDIS